jgi:hypothetical protein
VKLSGMLETPCPGPAHLADPDQPTPTALGTAARNYDRALERFIREAGLAA